MNLNKIAILGRQPEISIAELETLCGADNIKPVNNIACIINSNVDFKRIGSSSKLLLRLETSDSSNFNKTLAISADHIVRDRLNKSGKLQLGLSIYGRKISTKEIAAAGLKLKKTLKIDHNLSVRLIPNKAHELNAAQILRNKLTKENGFELNLIYDGNIVHLAKTIEVQDIDEYSRRDREKPVRDPLVGMLPPKLAQTLINLTNAQPGDTLLDPFCGTGTVLMEAHVMGIASIGSDVSPSMIKAAQTNMKWLDKNYDSENSIVLADATNYNWPSQFTKVATETYLGPPMRTLPDRNILRSTIDEVDKIHRDFLKNLAKNTTSGTRICLAIPSWHDGKQFINLPMLDDLEKLGYNPSSFIHVGESLIYHRPNQTVGRRILSLVRK